MLSVSVCAHTNLTTIEHDPTHTHWNIFETGYTNSSDISINVHSSGNGIYIKTDQTIIDADCFINIENSIMHAKDAWRNASFNGTKIFQNKISSVASNYSLSTTDINNQKTLVKIYSIEDRDSETWATAIINYSPATFYTETSSGKHIKTCRIKINEFTLGNKPADKKETYQKYTLAHELGHVIGLADLSSDFNDTTFQNYLMGYSNYSITAPTSSDVKGAAVISGYHTSHSNYIYSNYSNAQHRKICGACDGYLIENHTMGSWMPYTQYTQIRFCTKCGKSEVR